MAVGIVRTELSGLAGGPGLSQMTLAVQGTGEWNGTLAQSAVNAVRAFWASIAASMPNDVTLQTQPAIDVYDDISGQLIDSVSASSTPASVVGTVTTGYASGAGAKIDWQTGQILAGRRVVGHTYVVPLGASAYENDGSIVASTIANAQSAINTYLAALNTGSLWHVVWTRPRVGSQSPPGASVVTSGVMRDKTAFLRGRRD